MSAKFVDEIFRLLASTEVARNGKLYRQLMASLKSCYITDRARKKEKKKKKRKKERKKE